MNRWKIAFFFTLFTFIGGVVFFLFWLKDTSPTIINDFNRQSVHGYSVQLKTTKENLQGITNSFLQKEIGKKELPIFVHLNEDVQMHTQLQIFSIQLPVVMHFDPIIESNGDITLKHTAVEVGKLDIPPKAVLKLMKESINLPKWLIVQPENEKIFLKLNQISLKSKMSVRAKQIDLNKDEILFELYVPSN